MEFFGVRLLGFTGQTLRKLVLTLAVAAVVVLVRAALVAAAQRVARRRRDDRLRFWSRQAIRIVTTALFALALLSIWFDDPARLATGLGLVTAGLAFALQKVVTSLAGYAMIMRSETFAIGDRITMGGVRGDVIALGFLQTTIMEIGEPDIPGADAPPGVWVRGRQYTGRIVTVTNDKVFDEPVYNYTRDFPLIWEEIKVPITYRSDRRRAEAILLECATRLTEDARRAAEPLRAAMEDKYHVEIDELAPRVYYRITDNWLELTVRFVVDDRRSRVVKDAMARAILDGFDAAGIGIASATVEIVGVPPLRLEREERRDTGVSVTAG